MLSEHAWGHNWDFCALTERVGQGGTAVLSASGRELSQAWS